ncbi:hypothetical protein, partial [Pseudomonas sp. ICMP 460]|uniref:hypothetical protein n=1 Tax=Pseudomonas sp. ICMP 460 TaxID=1718917 RepID=UPI001C461BF9
FGHRGLTGRLRSRSQSQAGGLKADPISHAECGQMWEIPWLKKLSQAGGLKADPISHAECGQMWEIPWLKKLDAERP